MKHLIFLALALFASTLFAQNTNDVTLTVVGSGKTIEEAKTNALRSAIEQAYGAFVSSNTEILNDEIVKDEIVSISSGNIKEFKILSQSELMENLVSMTLSATVSVSQLQSYAQSKGARVEFAGGTVAMNAILTNLNIESEYIAIKNLCAVLENLLSKSLDFSLNVEDTKCGEKDCTVTFKIEVSVNSNIDLFYQLFEETLGDIGMSSSEMSLFKKNNRKTFLIMFGKGNKGFPKIKSTYYLRNLKSVNMINSLLYQSRSFPFNIRISNNQNINTNMTVLKNRSHFLLNDFERQELGFPAATYVKHNDGVISTFLNKGIMNSEKFNLNKGDIFLLKSPTTKNTNYGVLYTTQSFSLSQMQQISSFEIINMNLQ
jgi:hypothetical protein